MSAHTCFYEGLNKNVEKRNKKITPYYKYTEQNIVFFSLSAVQLYSSFFSCLLDFYLNFRLNNQMIIIFMSAPSVLSVMKCQPFVVVTSSHR